MDNQPDADEPGVDEPFVEGTTALDVAGENVGTLSAEDTAQSLENEPAPTDGAEADLLKQPDDETGHQADVDQLDVIVDSEADWEQQPDSELTRE